jgi:hypothetical protein
LESEKANEVTPRFCSPALKVCQVAPKRIRSSVRIHSAAPTGEGAGYAATNEATRQSGIGAEGGVTGMEGYLRRQRVWFSHA